ncbi:hypothetical protein XELAEV_18024651mg, partial [Xenopus laevis]
MLHLRVGEKISVLDLDPYRYSSDDMNCFFSNLILTPTVTEDHGAQYICRTHHYKTGVTTEKRMEMQVLVWAPPCFIWFLLISLSLTGTDALGVKTSDSPIKSLRNQDAFIPCTVTEYGAGKLDVKLLSVIWTLKSLNGSEEWVYLYKSGHHTPTRPGSYISDSDLITGNVGLHLPRVQFTDEGEYTCTVIYTPNKAVGKSALQASVQPATKLEPPDVSGLLGTEKTVQCAACGFYPKDITIQWVKRLSETNCISLDKDSCTGDTSENEDGAFNVTSHLTIKPSLEDNGRRYLCIIKHRSLENKLKLNFTLSIPGKFISPPPEDKTTVPVLVVIFLTIIIAALRCFLYWKFLKKEPPKLSSISGVEHLVHMNKATLSCQIIGFRPKPIRITLWLKRKGEEEMEIHFCDLKACSSTPVAHYRDEECVVIGTEREGLMRNGNVTNLPLAQRPLSISYCQCLIHITPDIEEDDGAELTVRVTHSALRLPISESCRLEVTQAVPKLDPILASSETVYGGQEIGLSCRNHSFLPKSLTVFWYKEDELLEPYNDQILDANGLFYFTSHINYRPCVRDIGKKFRWPIPNEKKIVNVAAVPNDTVATYIGISKNVVCAPTASEIQCTPATLECDKPARLLCTMKDFFPKYCSISWYWGERIMPQSSVKEVRQENPTSGLFSRTTELQFTPTINHHGTEFQVEIMHCMETISRTFTVKLRGLPYIEYITSNGLNPKVGEELLLQCNVTGANAQDMTAEWLAGSDPIKGETKTYTKINRDSVTFLFAVISTIEHYGKIFTCLIKHRDLQEPVKRNITLKWKDHPPTLSDIEVHPTTPEVNKEATFSITISGFSQKNHQVRWFLKGSQIPESLKKDATKEEDNVPNLIETSEPQVVCSSTLKYSPTDKDDGTFIRCVFTAKEIIREKKYQLSLT